MPLTGDYPLAGVYAHLRPTAYGAFVLFLCVLVGTVEGYDVQLMSLAAPLLAKNWGLSPQAIGPLLSASLIGQVVGGFLLAPLGDRWGRRSAMLIGLAIAGTSTFLAAWSSTYTSLLALRFVAGLGLGMALANTIALAMELVPVNWRTISVVLVCAGYPLGAAAGAAGVGALLATHGVAAVFYVGGFSTFVAFLLCLALLPESPVTLALRSNGQERLRRLLKRLGMAVDPGVRLTSDGTARGSSRIAALFTAERRTATLLLWLLMFANLSLVYFFIMWLPSLIVRSGLDPQAAIRATSLFSFSGIFGGLALAALLPRMGAINLLGLCYATTLAAVAAFANISVGGTPFDIVLFCCGFLIIGSQFCLNAVISLFYPGPIRATGSGFALGAGRIGGVFAPIVGGLILSAVDSPRTAFYVGMVPAAISLIALLALRQLRLVGLRSA